jgi:hypothetical protein
VCAGSVLRQKVAKGCSPMKCQAAVLQGIGKDWEICDITSTAG